MSRELHLQSVSIDPTGTEVYYILLADGNWSINMDYFTAAFGGFSPDKDLDAAIKFVLHGVLMDHGFERLSEVMEERNKISALVVEPGWMLERRSLSKAHHPAYAKWPSGSRFRAYVEPDANELRYPEFFMNRDQLIRDGLHNTPRSRARSS